MLYFSNNKDQSDEELMMEDYVNLHFRAFNEINRFLIDDNILHELQTTKKNAKAIITSDVEYQPLHTDCFPQSEVLPHMSFTGNLSFLSMTKQFKLRFAPGSHIDSRSISRVRESYCIYKFHTNLIQTSARNCIRHCWIIRPSILYLKKESS